VVTLGTTLDWEVENSDFSHDGPGNMQGKGKPGDKDDRNCVQNGAPSWSFHFQAFVSSAMVIKATALRQRKSEAQEQKLPPIFQWTGSRSRGATLRQGRLMNGCVAACGFLHYLGQRLP
jgi:hypothetical protein